MSTKARVVRPAHPSGWKQRTDKMRDARTHLLAANASKQERVGMSPSVGETDSLDFLLLSLCQQMSLLGDHI